MLNKFYAVTTTSLYRVVAKGADGLPEVEKIAIKRPSSVRVGQKLESGTMVAICDCIRMFIPEGGGITSLERRVEYVNTAYWGGQTSKIVALFLRQDDAIKCLHSYNIQACDPRWHIETREVVELVGDNHPNFVVCKAKGMSLT